MNPVFRTAKVNANLQSCTAPITASPRGAVDQGGGYWFAHGTTGPTGTVSFYTFPGSIKLRMSYSHMSVTRIAVAIAAGTNQVDFQSTAVTLNSAGAIKSPTGGSWWFFAKPTMDLLPGSYSFLFQNGATWSAAVRITVSGCDMNAANLRVVDENGNGVAGATATPAVGGTWQPNVPGATNAAGYLVAQLPTGTTKVKMSVNQGAQEQTSAEMVASSYTWTTEILRIALNDHAGTPITTGAWLDQGGGYWYDWGSLGAYRDIPLCARIAPYKFKVTYNFTSQEQSGIAVSAGAGVTTFNFQTGQVFGSCITQYSASAWRTFTNDMALMPGSYNTFKSPSQPGVIAAGGITNLTCP